MSLRLHILRSRNCCTPSLLRLGRSTITLRHQVAVVTEYPLGDILRNKEANGRIIKWAIELATYSIDFRGRQMIKSQVLVDFIIEWTDMQAPVSADRPEHWVMYFDGSLNLDGAGAGIFFISPSRDHLRYVL